MQDYPAVVGKSVPIVSVADDAPHFKDWKDKKVLGDKIYEELSVILGCFDMHTLNTQHTFEQSLWELGNFEKNKGNRFVVGSGQKEKRMIVINADATTKYHLYSLEEYFGLAPTDDSRPSLPKVSFSDFVLPASMNRYLFVESNPMGVGASEAGERMSAHARGREGSNN